MIMADDGWFAALKRDPPIRPVPFVMDFFEGFKTDMQQRCASAFRRGDLFMRRNRLIGRKLDWRVHHIIKATILYVGVLPVLSAVFADPTFRPESDLSFCSLNGFDGEIKIAASHDA